ncbi:MAG: chloramphenicol acetyltransferase [Muribaculaceae bacterium]|nr:chloramphenicol acetyltransferase [Muribaculaceae bacterium]
MVTEIDPKDTTRAFAFEAWMQAPMPMVTFFKTLNVTPLVNKSKRDGLKFNMLMCWCIGKAASRVKEFYMLPVNGKLMKYDSLAVNTIVMNRTNEVSSCDVPFCEDLERFNSEYIRLTEMVKESCENHDETEKMVIGTSALVQYDIDGAVGMYSGIFNNPFMIWAKYRREHIDGFPSFTLKVSFQFHHTQMDGAHAATFLGLIQECIDKL